MEHSRREETGRFPSPWKERSAGLSGVGTCVGSRPARGGGVGTEEGNGDTEAPCGGWWVWTLETGAQTKTHPGSGESAADLQGIR